MNPEVFISVQAREILEDLLAKAENRDPDAQGMYVYNGGLLNERHDRVGKYHDL